MAEIFSGTPVLGDWRESLTRSNAQIATGESVPLLPILDRLRASAERLEAGEGAAAEGADAAARR